MADESPAERHAAVGQLLDHYAHAAAAVSVWLELPQRHGRIRLPEVRRPDLVAALAPDTDWMEAERANIRALIRLAAEGEHPESAWRLARLTWRFHYTRGYSDEILETHRLGLAAAIRLGDEEGIATMDNYLASAYFNLSDYQAATQHLNRAIELRRGIGDRQGERISQGNLAIVLVRLGRLQEAADLLRSVHRAGGLVSASTNLGMTLAMLGRCEEALRVQRAYLLHHVMLGKTFAVAQELGNLGATRLRMGHFQYAVRLLRASLALRTRTRERHAEADVLNDLGVAYRHLGRPEDAERMHRQAIATAVDVGARETESTACNDLGLTLTVLGQPDAAIEAHRQALDLAAQIRYPYEQGRALAALADHLEPSDPAEARRHRERALAIFRKMGVPEAAEVERRLAGAGPTLPGQGQ